MSSQDDPEERIRELERSLSDRPAELTQSPSELGTPQHDGGYATPPPLPQVPYPAPQSPYGATQSPYGTPYGAPFPSMQTTPTGGTGRSWLGFGILAAVLLAVIGGTAILFSNAFSSVNSFVDAFDGSPTASGGGGTFGAPSRSGGNRPSAPTVAPAAPVEPPGGNISVSGVGDDRTIACNDSVVNVSGVSNTVVLTGQCRSVTVSGVENTVTIDVAATISASGFDNRVTFLSGTPEIQNSGDSNVVERG